MDWLAPQAARTSCRFAHPPTGGQYQRPGKAGSAVFALDKTTAAFMASADSATRAAGI
jgi:hypothetical protein